MLSYIHAIPALQDNYIWAVVQPPHCIVIDPGDSTPVVDFLCSRQLSLCGILVTHHHLDHTGGLQALTNQYYVPVWGPAEELIPEVTTPVHGGSCITIPELATTYTVLPFPGHTSGHIGYYDGHRLFCGDTLFAAGMGKIFEGTPEEMLATIERIQALPDNTWIYPAHEYTLSNLRFAKQVEPDNIAISTRLDLVQTLRHQKQPTLPTLLMEERATNPFLRYHQPQVQRAVQAFHQHNQTDTLAIFSGLRHWKDII